MSSFYNLGNNQFAVRFPYHQVTLRTVWMALPSFFRGRHIKFLEESQEMAGKRRMDSLIIEITCPEAVEFMRSTGQELRDYILIEIVP